MARKRQKGWSFSAGERGRNRVRAFLDHGRGLYLEWYEPVPDNPTPRRARQALGHNDQERAKGQAEAMAAALRAAEGAPVRSRTVTLRELFDKYEREVTPSKSRQVQRHDKTTAELFTRALGADRKPSTIDRSAWDAFIRDRSSGVLRPLSIVDPCEVGPRQVAYDLKFLVAVLNWATTVNDAEGRPLLERNPVKGFAVPTVASPNQPLLAPDEVARMIDSSPAVHPYLFIALVLCYETGHRLSSVRQLRWSDVDFAGSSIRWRADGDKIELEHSTPLPERAAAALKAEQVRQAAVGEAWVFRAARNAKKPACRSKFLKWWAACEPLAKVTHRPGLGFHSLRRRFATDLSDSGAPLKDICKLGGWLNETTVLGYIHPSSGKLRATLAARPALPDVKEA